MTTEQTINRSAKTIGEITSFSRNPNAYYRRSITRHKRALYLEATRQQLDMKSDAHDTHKTVRVSVRKHIENDIRKLVAASRILYIHLK